MSSIRPMASARLSGIERAGSSAAGLRMELFIIDFEKDKMTLRVPTLKAKAVGMRKLSSPEVVGNALNTLKGRARIKRTMWSRRAQEYEAKIDLGHDLVSIAEVSARPAPRRRPAGNSPISERQLYEKALARMAREVAAVERTDEQTRRQARRRHADEESSEVGFNNSLTKKGPRKPRFFVGFLLRLRGRLFRQHTQFLYFAVFDLPHSCLSGVTTIIGILLCRQPAHRFQREYSKPAEWKTCATSFWSFDASGSTIVRQLRDKAS